MKKIIAILSVAAMMMTVAATSGCMRTAKPEEPVTEEAVTEFTAQTTEAELEEDLALPAVNENPTTAAIVVPSTIPQVVHMPKPSAKPATTTTTTTQSAEEEDPTPGEDPAPVETPEPAVTETVPEKGSPDLLNKSILSVINNGQYTMVLSKCFTGKDRSVDDKIIKYVHGGQKAYELVVPSANYDVRVFSENNLYYVATPTMYCTITKAEFNSLCKDLDSILCEFDQLDYQKSDEVREGLVKYKREYFDVSGTSIILWYKSSALDRLQMIAPNGDEVSFPMTVSGTVDDSKFTLYGDITQSTFDEMKPLTDFIHAAFSV